jgi:predicted cupin superfamily sugar epimerase
LVSTTDPEAYSLVGCTVAPGFEFRDLELAKRDALLAAYPTLRDEIIALTRP